jgi:transketolase
MVVASQSLEELCINVVRFLAVDAVEKAKSDRSTADGSRSYCLCPLGLILCVLTPKNPQWVNCQSFCSSARSRLYAGVCFDVPDRILGVPSRKLKNSGSGKSKTPGQSENFVTEGWK